jgi:hypothetical protein
MSQAVFSAARPSPTAAQLSSSTFSNPTLIPIVAPSICNLSSPHPNAGLIFVNSINWMSPSTQGGTMQGRPLTYDEQKAADAAFAGQPFNSDWSNDAKAVYDGIAHAMSACSVDSELEPAGR